MAMNSSSSLTGALSTSASCIRSLSLLVSQLPRASFSYSSAAVPFSFGRSQPAALSKSVGDCGALSEFSVRKRFSSLVRRDQRRTGRARAGGDGRGCDPDSEKGKFFVVTTPLYYVNAAPHMGSAYPTIAADALARFQRLQGRKVVFITGTDEHGEKIATSAADQGRQPKEHCDLVAAEYQALWKELGISYDRFIRTTEVNHEKIVDEFYRRVLDNGDIYRADYEGLYCVNCEEYKDEKELLEDKQCPIHRKPCQHRKEDNYFFSLSKYQQKIDDLLSENPYFVRPSFRRNEISVSAFGGWYGT